jgi:hypothetical protein
MAIAKDCPRTSEIAVLQNNHSNMASDIKETKETCEKILVKLDTFHATFVTKEEHKVAH